MYTLSTESILQQIYAFSALRAYMSVNKAPVEQAPILSKDRREALTEIVTATAIAAAAKLNATDTRVSDDSRSITIELPGPAALKPMSISRALAQLIAYKTLAAVNTGYDNSSADHYGALASDLMTDLLAHQRLSPWEGARIIPNY